MIEAKDLRIGNLVIDLDGSLVKIASGADIEGTWNPILLTEEILIKAGFEIVNSYFSDGYTNPYVKFDKLEYKKSGFALDISEGNIVTLYLAYEQDASNLSQAYSGEFTNYEAREVLCKYVHQLQNLYYVLTGEELEINL